MRTTYIFLKDFLAISVSELLFTQFESNKNKITTKQIQAHSTLLKLTKVQTYIHVSNNLQTLVYT